MNVAGWESHYWENGKNGPSVSGPPWGLAEVSRSWIMYSLGLAPDAKLYCRHCCQAGTGHMWLTPTVPKMLGMQGITTG